jgi:hypothetical protein
MKNKILLGIALFSMFFGNFGIALGVETLEGELIEPRLINTPAPEELTAPVPEMLNNEPTLYTENNVEELSEEKLPSKFGLFFQNLKENIDVTFTFSQEKRIEKRLKYAENKIEVANKILNSSNEENLEKRSEIALSMMKSAEKYINKVQNKEIILSLKNEKEGELLKDFPQMKDILIQIMSLENEKEGVYSRIERSATDEKIKEIILQKQENYKKQEEFFKEIQEEEGLDFEIKEMIQNRAMDVNMKKEMEQERIDTNLNKGDEVRRGPGEGQKDKNNENENNLEVDSDNILCTMQYAPVCGINGVTYSNRCVAEMQNKVKVLHEGECNNNLKNNNQEEKIEESESENINIEVEVPENNLNETGNKPNSNNKK